MQNLVAWLTLRASPARLEIDLGAEVTAVLQLTILSHTPLVFEAEACPGLTSNATRFHSRPACVIRF